MANKLFLKKDEQNTAILTYWALSGETPETATKRAVIYPRVNRVGLEQEYPFVEADAGDGVWMPSGEGINHVKELPERVYELAVSVSKIIAEHDGVEFVDLTRGEESRLARDLM